MVEQVRDLELFHACQAVAYNRNAPMEVGQALVIGQRQNPFFGYYETPPSFTVRMEDGEVRSLNPIHWLENVQLGKINPDNLPEAALQATKHFQMLSRELIMELVRREHTPHAPSRKTCLWASDNMDIAAHWKSRLRGASRMVRLLCTGVIHRADAALMVADAEPISITEANALRYWLGEEGPQPEREILFEGTATVIELL